MGAERDVREKCIAGRRTAGCLILSLLLEECGKNRTNNGQPAGDNCFLVEAPRFSVVKQDPNEIGASALVERSQSPLTIGPVRNDNPSVPRSVLRLCWLALFPEFYNTTPAQPYLLTF